MTEAEPTTGPGGCRRCHFTTSQPEAGRPLMPRASPSVFGPRSLSYTAPSSVTMKVITPDDRYSSGYVTNAKPPFFLPPET
jgi:hypothetical protein